METKGWLMTLKAGDQAPSSGKRDANTVFWFKRHYYSSALAALKDSCE
jgi:hypothetical protein